VYSVQCSKTVIGVCTVHSAVRLLLVCVQCTVQNETYWCVYRAHCSETVIGVCTVYIAVKHLLVCVQCTV